MYAKRLNGGDVLFFRNAPPLTPLDVNVGKRPTEPYPKAEQHQCSVYYFWWAFLRENTVYMECCANGGSGPMAELYADFGDVRGADDRQNFMKWWKRTRVLFSEPPEQKIQFFDEPPLDYDGRNRILLSLPITGDIDKTFTELRRKLGPLYREARQRLRDAARSGGKTDDREKDISLARYPIVAKPVLTALYGYLRVWQELKLKPDATPTEIADRAGILKSISGREEEPNRVRQRVQDYEKKAATLIANVGEGRFPDFNPNFNARNSKGAAL